MNMVEIERALRELRLAGIAETLFTRMTQAEAARNPSWRPSRPCCRRAGPPALSPDQAPPQALGS